MVEKNLGNERDVPPHGSRSARHPRDPGEVELVLEAVDDQDDALLWLIDLLQLFDDDV